MTVILPISSVNRVKMRLAMKNILRKTVGVMLILLILLSSFTACVNGNTDTDQPSGDGEHTHAFLPGFNESEHYIECACGEITDRAEHIFEWVIDVEPTDTTPGTKHKECLICGYSTQENTTTPTLSKKMMDEKNPELNEVFTQIQIDSFKNEKIKLSVSYMDLHYESIESGQYKNSKWFDSIFRVQIKCNYECAKEEEWYVDLSDKDNRPINEELYNYYKNYFENGQFKNGSIFSGIMLHYSSMDDFLKDYSKFISMGNLTYVTNIYINYDYGFPSEFMYD